jgi:phage recombination protein Bet
MNALVPARLKLAESALAEAGITPQQWRVLVDAIFPNAKSPESVVLALDYCKARGLDPFKRPVHIVPMYNSALGREVETVWPGINSICTEAARTGAWAGMDAPQWGPDVTQTFEGRTKQGPVKATVTFPEWCSVTVHRIVHGQRCAFTETVYWLESFAAIGRSGVPNDMWQKRPRGQLLKCCRAAVLRTAFPECADYAAEEMEGRDIKVGGTVIEHEPEPSPAVTVTASEAPAMPPGEGTKTLREFAQDIAGTPRDQAPPAAEGLPLITPDGKLHTITRSKKTGAPEQVVWVAAWKRAIGLCEDASALRSLRRENGPLLASVSEKYPAVVKEVERAIEARLADLTAAPDDGWPEPDAAPPWEMEAA